MRRLARHLFTAFAAGSLMLCVAATGAWMLGYHDVRLTSVRAGIDDSPAPGYDLATILRCSVDKRRGRSFRFLVLVLNRESRPGVEPAPRVTWTASVPLWAAIGLAVVPSIGLGALL